jgi:hypothetical protein
VTTATAALAVGIVVASAAEWPSLPSDSSEGATVWDPGPRWPTLASERPEGKPAGADAERRRAQPPPVAADPGTTGSIRPRTQAPTQDAAATGDLGPQWPSVAAEHTGVAAERTGSAAERTGSVPERLAATDMSAVSSRPAMPEVSAPATVPAAPDLPATPDLSARQGRRAQPSSAADADTTGSIGTAQWPAYVVPAPIRPIVVTVGGRYWYSRGSTDFNFRNGVAGYGDPTSTLDWNGTTGHSGEVFGRIDHRPTGLFVKGLFGGGTLTGGTITDRDFVYGQYSFSDTSSDIRGDNLLYGMVDAGWSFDVPKVGLRIGGFVGYHYWNETMTAFGLTCNRDDFGGAFCGPAGSVQVPYSTAVLGYEPTWHALRLGIDGRWEFLPGWSVAGEVAYVPIAHLENKDSHLLRQSSSDLGPAPNVISRSSSAWGVEAEVFLNYAVTPNVELGVGGRYWGLNANGGTVAFGPSFVGSYDLTKFEQQRYGLLLQAKGRF